MNRKISFVIPAFNEEESIPELYECVRSNIDRCVSDGLMDDYEFLFINDGSTDGTIDAIRALRARDDKVHYISFRKNFGKSIALQTAFRNLSGDTVVTMDADLQDDPDELGNLLRELDKGYDMIVGWKVNRLDPAEKRLPSKLFNRVTSKMSGLQLHDFDCGYKCFTRAVADSLDVYGAMHRYIPVMARRSGFKIAEIPVHHNKRKYGKSKYGIERYLQGLFDFLSVFFLTRFDDRPLYFFGRLGLISGAIGFVICLVLLILALCGGASGCLPLLVSGILLIAAGVQFLGIGFIGNMLVDQNCRRNYTEHRILEKVL